MSEEIVPYFQRFKQIKLGLAPKEAVAKPKKAPRQISLKKQAEIASEKEMRGEGDTELQKWYAAIMKKENPVCWETGEAINKKDVKGWHGSIAHVLPKNDYPTVATHPLNYMILKMWGGTHGQYDSNWENASKMKVWNHAIKIFNILFLLLTPEEKRKLPDVIIQEIKPEIYNS